MTALPLGDPLLERNRRAHRLKPLRHQIFYWDCWRTVTEAGPCTWDSARVEIRTAGQPSFTLPANAPIRSRLVPPTATTSEETS